MEILEGINVGRLTKAVEFCYKKMDVQRQARYKLVEQIAGPYGVKEGEKKPLPVNMLEMAAHIFLQQTAARAPLAWVYTENRSYAAQAEDFAVVLNYYIKRKMRIQETMRRLVMNMFVGESIAKVAKWETDENIPGIGPLTGPVASCVSFDDWVIDQNAKTYGYAQFAGDRYRMTIDKLERLEGVNQTVLDKLRKESDGQDQGSEDRVENIEHGRLDREAEFRPQVELWDIWIPDDQLIVTLVSDQGKVTSDVLRQFEWDGPEEGPYCVKGAMEIPDQLHPLPPLRTLKDLHEFLNVIFRKLAKSEMNRKKILGVMSQAAKDAERVVKAPSDGVIKMDHPEGIKEFEFNGASPTGMAMFMQSRDLFSYMAGNLESMGGLGPMADTLGQDEMISSTASKRIVMLQERIEELAGEILHNAAWYLWHNPIREIRVQRPLPGGEGNADVIWNPETREGSFFDYHIEIRPFSMSHETPQMRLQKLLNIFNQVVAPGVPLLQQQGLAIDMAALLNRIAKLADLNELGEIVIPAGQMQPGAGVNGNPLPMPDVTSRTNIRINRPGATRIGKDQALMGMLLAQGGPGVQAKERMAVGRPVG